jgi:two-component system cell cycle sensor histidine kinase/response regulator CckA
MPNSPQAEKVLSTNSRLRHIERHEWYLWMYAVSVTLLLTLAVASLAVLIFHTQQDPFYLLNLGVSVRGLVALVLLFDLYVLYQQYRMHRIRGELAEEKELLCLIGDNAADMIAVVDANGRRFYNSPAYEKILGYSAEELKGTSAFEQVHPDDRAEVMQAAEEACRTGVGRRMEYRMHCKDGTWRILESTASVIPSGTGGEERLVIVNRDITERQQAEEALRRSEAQYRALFENANDAILIFEPENEIILAANSKACEIYGLAHDQLVGRSLKTMTQNVPRGERQIRELLAAGTYKDYEAAHYRGDGKAIDLLINASVIEFQGRRAILSINRDLTEWKQMEAQLRQAQKMEAVGALAGGVAHDFNNLLAVILGHSELIAEEEASEQVRRRGWQIKKAAEDAAELTRQLLTFSRKQPLSPAALGLNGVISDMEEMLRRLLGEDVELTTVLDAELRQVTADKGQLQQVMMNLAANARDAMPHGGRFSIETANVELDEHFARRHPPLRAGSHVLLMVSDNGTGMDAATQARIFEPFFTTKARGKGTGLGLATAYSIVQQSGGHICVKSKLGEGTTFEIYLPSTQEQAVAPAVAPVAGATPAERPIGWETVLLVEDAEALRALAKEILETHGYGVLEAETASEAIQVAHRYTGPIDLLLTDVILPGMDGRQLAESLMESRPEMKILYVSGYSDSILARRGVLTPGSMLVHKPFARDALVRRVREVLDAGQSVSN